MTFVSDESGHAEVYITTFPSPGRHVRVSADGSSSPRWRDDGAEVFFTSAGKLMAATVAADPAAGVPVFESARRASSSNCPRAPGRGCPREAASGFW